MFCTNCGKQIEDDSTYCSYCGSKIEKVEKIEEKKVEKIEEKKVEKIEEKKVEKIEESEYNIIKGLNIPKILVTLCAIGLIASAVNIFRFYILGTDINYIFGQMIFILVFLVSTVLLWRSKKIGGVILISFILFKVVSSIYYYFEASYGYLIKNLLLDEIFYLAIILLLLIDWRNLK